MEGTRYTTRESLRVRRWFIERQIELTEARLRYHRLREIEQIEAKGDARAKTMRQITHFERQAERLRFELEAINDLIAETRLHLFDAGLASA